MREIKFRVFDVFKDMMDYSPGITFWTEQKDDPIEVNGFSPKLDNDAVSELMQYTGLKDKNGKEIYEGDIVIFVGGTANFLKCGNYSGDVHEKGTKLVVIRLDSGFTLCQSPDEFIPNVVGNVSNYDFWNHQMGLEIIGNIYENPELLEK